MVDIFRNGKEKRKKLEDNNTVELHNSSCVIKACSHFIMSWFKDTLYLGLL